MKRNHIIALCLLGLFVGILTGSMLPRSKPDQTSPGTSSNNASSPASQASPPKPSQEPKHDLPSLLKRWDGRDRYLWSPEIQGELERMSVPQLRRFIEKMSAIFNDSSHPDSGFSHLPIVLASMELYRREGEAALEWSSTTTGPRSLIMSWMLYEAAIDSPDLVKRWITKMGQPGGFEEGWWQNAIYSALAGARSRSADDLLKLYASFGTLIPEHAYASGTFPPGFDYQKLFHAFGAKVPLEDMVQYWSATDRDAAWASVKEMIDSEGKGTVYAGSLFSGAAAIQGSEDTAKWLIPKLEELPEPTRTEAVLSLTRGVLSPESITIIMATLSQESDRIAIARSYINVGSTDGQDLAALRGLTSDSSRSTVLLAAANSHAPALANAEPRHATAIRTYFLKTMETLHLPEATQAEIMEVLETPR